MGNCCISAIIVASEEGLLLHTVRYLENLEKEGESCKKQSTADKVGGIVGAQVQAAHEC